ncbi:MAG TPA: carbohydrate-binding domain-containing protein [Sumerlaeia bacterium]|nr:carbohydrate-binding domain-containing protein [Sumerlaeia bacterium]
MRVFLLTVCVAVLALSVGAAAQCDYEALGRLTALALLALIPFLYLLRERGQRNWTHYSLPVIAVAFLYLSRVGAATDPALGVPAAVAVHLLIWTAYVAFMIQALRRVVRGDTDREEIAALDLWLANLGIICLLLFVCDEFADEGLGMAAALRGLARGIVFLSLGAAFVLTVKNTRTWRQMRAVSTLCVLALLAAAALGGARILRIRGALDAAERELAAGAGPAALDALERAEALNGTLQRPDFEKRVLDVRRDVYSTQGRYDLALGEMARRLLAPHRATAFKPQDLERLEFLQRYLNPDPLEPLTAKYAALKRVDRFFWLHDDLRQDAADYERLLLLFLQNGLLDRLEEAYATAGLPEIQDPGPFVQSLERIEADAPERSSTAQFFLGVLAFRAGDDDRAEKALLKALEVRPERHNALAFLERIAQRRGRADHLRNLQARPRAIAMQEMIGNHRVGESVNHTLRAAFEVNPGVYRVELEVCGRPAAGVWPEVSVYLSDAPSLAAPPGPILTATVKSAEWTTVRFEITFDRPARHRLLIAFNNDYYAAAGGKTEDRNLYFGQAKITFEPKQAE